MTLTVADLDRVEQDEYWLGYGYNGERLSFRETNATLVRRADRFVVKCANDLGWTYDDLFAWANSKHGRWYGDSVFGAARASATFAQNSVKALDAGLFEIPQD